MTEPTGPVTEIAFLPLKAGYDVNDPTNPAYKTWQECLTTVSAQEGFLRTYYGTELETPSMLNFFIDWTSISVHKRFIANKPIYGPFLEKIASLLSGPVALHHFSVLPTSESPTDTPCSYVSATQTLLATSNAIEIAHFHYIADPSWYIPRAEQFVAKVTEAKPKGYVGSFIGSVVEDVFARGDDEESGKKKGRAVVLCVGWKSREDHAKFKETEVFKREIGLLREGRGASEMHHVVFKTFPELSQK